MINPNKQNPLNNYGFIIGFVTFKQPECACMAQYLTLRRSDRRGGLQNLACGNSWGLEK